MKLRTLVLLVLCCLFAAGDLSAEDLKKKRRKKKKKEVAFKQGQIGIQAGGGFVLKPDYSKSEYGLYGTIDKKIGFPIFFRAEYGITDFLGAGLYFGMFKDELTITDVTNPSNVHKFEHSYKAIGLRVAYHQKLSSPKLDPYAALCIGTTMVKASSSTASDTYITPMDKAGLGFGAYAGANFYFTKNIGVFVEGGYGKWLPMVMFGASIKF
jgi:opacity protein-like surface antigen